jgi:hypothetical protein
VQPTTVEERRALVATTAPLLLGLAAFAVSALSAPLPSPRVGAVVLCASVLLVAAAGITGERASALVCAAMAALSFDFFRVAPTLVLHGRTLAEALAAFTAVALVTTLRR